MSHNLYVVRIKGMNRDMLIKSEKVEICSNTESVIFKSEDSIEAYFPLSSVMFFMKTSEGFAKTSDKTWMRENGLII